MSSPTTGPSVLIAGAGPSGLVLALALAQNGIAVRIIEKATSFHLGQRGSGIQPRTLELFHFLGYRENMVKEATFSLRVCMYKMPEGREPGKVTDMSPYLEPTPDVPFRNPCLIGQSHNEGLLRDHLAKYNVHVELGTELVSFEQDTQGVVSEVVHHKEDGITSTESIIAKYLISAEGAKSTVRKQLGITFLGETRDYERIYLADVYLKGISTEYWHQWGDIHSKMVWIRPTEHKGLFSITAGGAQVDVSALLASRRAMIDLVYEVTKHTEIEFGDTKWQSEFRPNIRMVDKFGEGRAFLVGDAAHVHSPTGGQGLNTGVQDSFNLAWKLVAVLKYDAPASLLESYTSERLLVVKDMLDITTALMKKTTSFKTGDKGAGSHVRRPTILHQIGVNYRWSEIVIDEQPKDDDDNATAAYRSEDPSVLRAGDRAPDAPGLAIVGDAAGTTSLFSQFKPTNHTALIFSTNADYVNSVLEALKAAPAGSVRSILILPKDSTASEDLASVGVDMTVVDSEGHAHTYYPPTSQGFNTVIVRPDGVAGAIVAEQEGVKKYLRGVFGV